VLDKEIACIAHACAYGEGMYGRVVSARRHNVDVALKRIYSHVYANVRKTLLTRESDTAGHLRAFFSRIQAICCARHGQRGTGRSGRGNALSAALMVAATLGDDRQASALLEAGAVVDYHVPGGQRCDCPDMCSAARQRPGHADVDGGAR
jgi:hypothetical protein